MPKQHLPTGIANIIGVPVEVYESGAMAVFKHDRLANIFDAIHYFCAEHPGIFVHGCNIEMETQLPNKYVVRLFFS